MKKIITFTACITSITFAAFAQKIDAGKVPSAVKTSFAKQYPGVATKWEKENGKYEASFKKDGNTMSALFEKNGTMTESETDIKVSALPAAVLAYVKANYKGKTIKEGAKITKADGTVMYEAEVDGKDVIFDSNGKFVKVMKG